MRLLFLISLLVCFIGNLSGQGNQIEVTVESIKAKHHGTGTLYFMLFSQEDGFPVDAKKAIQVGQIELNASTAKHTFKNIPKGKYAISVFLDKNGNQKVDRNAIGMPKEPVGASNMKGLGKPSFSKCTFNVSNTQTFIKLQFING